MPPETSFFPCAVFTPEQSRAVHKATRDYLTSVARLDDLRRLAHGAWLSEKLIPIRHRAILSGHTFPCRESFHDLQISYTLSAFGLYKQAHAALRSALELGMLSVYWNVGDDGHEAIQPWLRSRQHTPHFKQIWKRLSQHPNFGRFQDLYDLETRILGLGRLHGFVHTNGAQFSNALPFPDGGHVRTAGQRFSVDAFDRWSTNFAETVQLILVCHMVRYPIATVRYDWGQKFGIDVPAFGGLDAHEVDVVEQIVTPIVFRKLSDLAAADPEVAGILTWVTQLPDVSEAAVDDQMARLRQPLVVGDRTVALRAMRKRLRLARDQREDTAELEAQIAAIEAIAPGTTHTADPPTAPG